MSDLKTGDKVAVRSVLRIPQPPTQPPTEVSEDAREITPGIPLWVYHITPGLVTCLDVDGKTVAVEPSNLEAWER